VLNGVHGRPTRRTDWKVLAPTRTADVAPLDTRFPWELWPHVYFGLSPEQMEDKWFAYMERRKLRIHRSWTGFATYELNFDFEEGGFRIIRIRVNDEPRQYTRGNDAYEQVMAEWFVWAFFGGPNHYDHSQRMWDRAYDLLGDDRS
jgi:hypothetical protein